MLLHELETSCIAVGLHKCLALSSGPSVFSLYPCCLCDHECLSVGVCELQGVQKTFKGHQAGFDPSSQLVQHISSGIQVLSFSHDLLTVYTCEHHCHVNTDEQKT